MMLYALTSPCTPGAMPVPPMITISPGATGPVTKLAPFAKVTLAAPGSRAVKLNVALKPAVVAVTTMGPEFAPAVTVVEACQFAPVVADADPSDAPPLVTWNVTV